MFWIFLPRAAAICRRLLPRMSKYRDKFECFVLYVLISLILSANLTNLSVFWKLFLILLPYLCIRKNCEPRSLIYIYIIAHILKPKDMKNFRCCRPYDRNCNSSNGSGADTGNREARILQAGISRYEGYVQHGGYHCICQLPHRGLSAFQTSICDPLKIGCSLGSGRSYCPWKRAISWMEPCFCGCCPWKGLYLWTAARKKADFMAGKVFSRSPAKIRGDFLAGSVADKKETPVKDVSVTVW